MDYEQPAYCIDPAVLDAISAMAAVRLLAGKPDNYSRLGRYDLLIHATYTFGPGLVRWAKFLMTSAAALKSVNVLVIDDNEHMVAITCTMLRAFGFGQVLGVEDGQKGLDLLSNTSIDLIVVDYRMPHMDGLTFVHKLRREPDSPDRFVPIIMLTAHSEKLRICQARDTGVTEFLCKPVAAAELFRKIATVIENPRPFVSTENFFGPDRRRRNDPNYQGHERRTMTDTIYVEDIKE